MSDTAAFYSFRHTLNYRVAARRDRVVWIDYEQGCYEVFVQDIPGGKRKRVLACETDDGAPFSLVDLSPSGRYLLVSRRPFTGFPAGHDCKQAPFPPVVQLLLCDTQTQQVTQLSAASLATFHPSEEHIEWVVGGTVWSQPMGLSQPQKLLRMRGEICSLCWSPDGKKLAFAHRYDRQSSIGIYRNGHIELQRVSPTFGRDSSPVWSHDSKTLAFYRFHGPQPDSATTLFSAMADSFSVMVYHLHTGRVQTVWSCGLQQYNGFSRQPGIRPLVWRDSRRLLFSHNNSGWDHICQFHLETGEIEQLTEGQWLVHDYSVNRCGQVVFSHNRQNRHIYHIDTLAEQGVAFTTDKTTSDQQFWLPHLCCDGRHLLCLGSSSRESCQIRCIDTQTGQQSSLAMAARPSASQVRTVMAVPRTHSLTAADGGTFYSHLLIPEGDGLFPAVIHINGHPGEQALPSFHYRLDMSYQYTFAQLLLKQRFIVMDVGCRGSGGYGKAFSQAQFQGWNGASEYHDIHAATLWLSRHPQVDATRIAIIGHSWGGYLAALALAKDSALVRAGILINSCSSFPRELRTPHWQAGLFSGLAGESVAESIARTNIAEESSPWGWLDQWMSPVLIVHGDDDRCINFSESMHLAHALQCRSVEVESLVLSGEGHQFLLHSTWTTIARRALDFLQKHLARRSGKNSSSGPPRPSQTASGGHP